MSADNNAGADRFGDWGGRYVPETLIAPLQELTEAWSNLSQDEQFQSELSADLSHYVGRPTPLYRAERLSEHLGGQILLKREDLCHTGAHKINNTVGQALLAKRMGKTRLIAETGAGQHGVATATVAARLGMRCTVFMGAVDLQRQALNVFRMRLLGAEVHSVGAGSATLKEAMSEAMREWVGSSADSFYVIGSAAGPHPYPRMVAEFQSVIGEESRRQCEEMTGGLPDAVVACVGGGSNAIGMFRAFVADKAVQLFGVEAAGEGLEMEGRHAATLNRGRPGVLHGSHSMLLQDADGQVSRTHSISAGLDYPGVGPEHAWLQQSGRAEYLAADDEQALAAAVRLCELEGILPALESAHALAALPEIIARTGEDVTLLVCLSGRGEKDMETLTAHFGAKL